MFKDYVLSFHKEKILNILKDEEELKHFSVNINFVELFEHDPILGNSILTNPEITLKQCDNILLEVQQELINIYEGGPILSKKYNVHTRIFGLPACPELHKIVFPTNEDLGLFLQISGTITRISAVKMLEYKREYMCTKCKYKFVINASYEQKYLISPPKKCTNPDFCKSSNFRVISVLDTNHCRDYQEFKMQEQFSKLQVSTMPSALWVTLEDDLVDVCKPGDSVIICGIVKRRWKIPSQGKQLDVELVIKANHIEISNDTSSTTIITSEILENFTNFWEKHETFPLYGRDLILRSFCPQIYGMYVVKLAIATVLAGGSTFERDKNTGTRVRTEPHLLLVGDPGMGKSQLLRYASKVIPRSVLTTGVGSTSAGLTVTAVMEDGEWHLEGGALVLADGGICCIDEFNSMKEHDRTSIHEAMEQQTISVAKASIVSKLSTRCSILAATNPKLSLDTHESLSITVALASPLLSRFDLILFLKDNMDNDRDEIVSNYILRGYKRKSKFFDNKYNMWSLEMLQAYFLIIKKLNPVLTVTSKQILGAYYQSQRKMESRDKSRTTVRLLDSLVRLSQAHARLMCHKEVETMDAIMALSLVEISMRGSSSTISKFFDPQSDFLDDPMKNYENLIKLILPELQLNDILKKELQKLKAYENGEVINTSRVNIMGINVGMETNLKNKNEIKKDIKATVASKNYIKQRRQSDSNNELSLNRNNSDESMIRKNNLDDLISEYENNKNALVTENKNQSVTLNLTNQNENVQEADKKNLIKLQKQDNCNKRRNKRKLTSGDEVLKNSKSPTTKKAATVKKSKTEVFKSDSVKSHKNAKIFETHDLNEDLSINSDIFSKEIEDAFNFIPKSTQNTQENLSKEYNSDLQNTNNADQFNKTEQNNCNLLTTEKPHRFNNSSSRNNNSFVNSNDELNDIKNFNIDDSDFEENNSCLNNVGKANAKKQTSQRNISKIFVDKNELCENNLSVEQTSLNRGSEINKENNKQDDYVMKSNDFNIEKDLLHLIPSAVCSQDFQEAFNFIPEDEVTTDKCKFKKNLSKLSIVKSDSGNFSINSQNIFESLDDGFDDSELDI